MFTKRNWFPFPFLMIVSMIRFLATAFSLLFLFIF